MLLTSIINVVYSNCHPHPPQLTLSTRFKELYVCVDNRLCVAVDNVYVVCSSVMLKFFFYVIMARKCKILPIEVKIKFFWVFEAGNKQLEVCCNFSLAAEEIIGSNREKFLKAHHEGKQ